MAAVESRAPANSSGIADPVEALYRQLAPAYDLIYGLVLHPGRWAAIRRMALKPGERVLEVGVGTGLSAVMYPEWAEVVAVDFSREMLARARARLQRRDIRNVHLMEGDATSLQLDAGSFDVVYAPYVINVVNKPAAVAREMRRVCRPGGRVIFLNHFRSEGVVQGRIHDALDAIVMAKAGVRWNLRLADVLDAARLEPLSIERVNLPRFSSLVVCTRA